MNKSKIAKFTTFDEFLSEALKNPEFRAEYDALETEYSLIRMLIGARIERNMTQAELASKAGMKQAAIARLETGKANPTYETLSRVAKAMDKKIALV